MKQDEDISSNIYNFTPLSDIHKHDSEAKIGKKIYTRIIFLNYYHPWNVSDHASFPFITMLFSNIIDVVLDILPQRKSNQKPCHFNK